jgi:flagellar assembly factor FliW
MSWEGDGEESTLELYVVVNIPEGIPEKMTANFIGPILFNQKERQAVQMVIPNSPYSHKYPLIEKNRRKSHATGP